MARSPISNVTGAGASYVAAGRKAQQTMNAKKPVSANFKPPKGGGLAHALQPSQFSVNRPASSPRSFNPSSSMHPGGAGMAASSIQSSRAGTPASPGGYAVSQNKQTKAIGNVRPGSPITGSRLSASGLAAAKAKRAPMPSNYGGGMQRKLGMRFGRKAKQAATTAVGRGKMPGKGNVIGRSRLLHFNASRNAGKNATNLRSITGAP